MTNSTLLVFLMGSVLAEALRVAAYGQASAGHDLSHSLLT